MLLLLFLVMRQMVLLMLKLVMMMVLQLLVLNLLMPRPFHRRKPLLVVCGTRLAHLRTKIVSHSPPRVFLLSTHLMMMLKLRRRLSHPLQRGKSPVLRVPGVRGRVMGRRRRRGRRIHVALVGGRGRRDVRGIGIVAAMNERTITHLDGQGFWGETWKNQGWQSV